VSLADAVWAPADGLRAAVYRALLPLARPLVADRARRVAWLGSLSVLVSFGLTLTVPLWTLALGPVLLGVPHLLADLRYLVVRPGLHRHRTLWLAALPLVATSFGAGPVVGLCAVAPVLAVAKGSHVRRAAVALVLAVLLGVAFRFGFVFQLVFLHLHNLVAVAVWWAWRRRDARALWVPLTVALGAALLLSGAAEPVLPALGTYTSRSTGTSFADFVETTTPLEDPTLALRVVLLFAFLQSVHYGMWLRLIPEEARARPSPRPFRASWQALSADLGRWPLRVATVLALGLAVWGAVDLPGARLGYLSLAAFHGYLELSALAFFFIEARRP
jgi:hypothetical protein